MEWIRDYDELRDLGMGFPSFKELSYLLSCPRLIEGEIDWTISQIMDKRLNVHVVLAVKGMAQWVLLTTTEAYTLPLNQEQDYDVCVFSGGGDMTFDHLPFPFKQGAYLFFPAGEVPQITMIPMTALVMMMVPAVQRNNVDMQVAATGLVRDQFTVRSNWLSC